MPAAPLVFVVGLLLVNLAISAVLLWVCCLVVGIRHETDDPDDPTKTMSRRVGIIRAFVVSVVVLLVGVLVTAGFGWALVLWPTPQALGIALLAALAASIVLPLIAMRVLLPGGWLRNIGAYLLWNVLACILVPINVAALWFNAEAFIVPTGAMADAVRGHHKEVTCPACGLTFTVNASTEAEPGEGMQPVRIDGCVCPNCRQNIVLHGRDGLGEVNPALGVIPDPGITSGERILTGKGFFGARHLPPRRFDVVVFDWPGEPGQPAPTTPMRYLMRLAGLPGEMIAIHRGKLYTLPPDQVPAVKGEGPPRFGQDEQAVALFGQGKFRILRKSPEQVLAMRHLVYDSDHAPRVGGQRWNGKGWQRQDGAFVATASDDAVVLRYQHLIAGADKPPQLITDYNGYNTGQRQGLALIPDGNWVSDLILDCEISFLGDGSLRLELSRGPSRYHAYFNLKQGRVSLERHGPGKEAIVLKQGAFQLPEKRWVRLRFANVDDHLLLWVDDKLPLGPGTEYDSPAKLAPVKENDLDRPASIHATGVGVSVRKLKLYRDTYYTIGRMGNPANADVADFNPADPDTWRHVADAPVAAYRVKDDHFFFLGDNSPQSSDSRSWGLVPRRNLQGRVFLRYWPLSRLGWLR